MSEGTNKDQDWIAAPSPADVATAKPPRARVEDAVDPEESARATMERKRDYLEGFLQKKPEGLPAGAPGGDLYEAVVAALKEIFDPEIPVNIYDLGLIYTIDIDAENMVKITMTRMRFMNTVGEKKETENSADPDRTEKRATMAMHGSAVYLM